MASIQDKRYGRGPVATGVKYGAIGTAAVLGGPLALKGGEWAGKGLLGGARWVKDTTLASYKGIYDKTKKWMTGPDIIPESHQIEAHSQSNRVPKTHRIEAHASSGNIPGGQNVASQAGSKLDEVASHVPTQNSIAKSQGMTRVEWLRNTKVGQAVGKIMRSKALGSANQVSMLSMAFGPSINAFKAMQNQEGGFQSYH